MQQREFVEVYTDHTDDSGFEYVNPNVVMSIGITDADDETVQVTVVNTDNNERVFEFLDVKEAQRFIRRVGSVV